MRVILYMVMKLFILFSMLLLVVSQAKIEKGDNIEISIEGVPEIEKKTVNGTYMVSPKGNIHLPFIKPVNVAELTSKELSERIESAYKKEKIYLRPNITVKISSDKGELMHFITEKRVITVRGQVAKTGPQLYRPGLTLIDAVTASNPNESAALNRVELLRNGKVYKYDMKIPAHAAVKLYPNDQVKLDIKRWKSY